MGSVSLHLLVVVYPGGPQTPLPFQTFMEPLDNPFGARLVFRPGLTLYWLSQIEVCPVADLICATPRRTRRSIQWYRAALHSVV